MRPRLLLSLVSLFSLLPFVAQAQKAAPMTSDAERAALHRSAEWTDIQPHLPDPATATATQLEVAGDVLRARRFPEDALDYYGYAIARGANVSLLLNKMGIVRLELRQYEMARQLFTRVVRADKHNAQAWNNLGAVEFITQRYVEAATHYRRAAKLDRKVAVYHANLGLVYFEMGNTELSRVEFARAAAIDPGIMQRRDDGGTSARLLAATDYPRLCFEMARVAALRNDPVQVRTWLARSAEGGFDVASALRDEPALHAFIHDPEVTVIIANAQSMKHHKVLATKSAPVLGPAVQRLD